jgi:hypothetical protein
MNLVDSIHGRVDPTILPLLDAKAAAEGRPTTPIYQMLKRDKLKKVEQAK